MHQHEGHNEEETIEAVEEQDGFGVSHAITVGKHVYFKVYGETSEVAYQAAKSAGIKVLDVRRLREQPKLVTELVELGPNDPGYAFDPKDPTKKMVYEAPLEKQPPVYRSVQTDDFDGDEDRAKTPRHLMETLREDGFTFVVKGLAPRAT